MKTRDEEEREARAWLARHADDPEVAGASLPGDHRRHHETGETIGRDRSVMLSGADRDGSAPNRTMLSYSKLDTVDDWEQGLLAQGYAPIVGRGGLTPEQLDKRIRVDRVLAAMRPEQGDLLRRRYIEQMTLEAIADEDGTSYQAVQQRLATATQDFLKYVGETWDEPYDLMQEVFGG